MMGTRLRSPMQTNPKLAEFRKRADQMECNAFARRGVEVQKRVSFPGGGGLSENGFPSAGTEATGKNLHSSRSGTRRQPVGTPIQTLPVPASTGRHREIWDRGREPNGRRGQHIEVEVAALVKHKPAIGETSLSPAVLDRAAVLCPICLQK
jgi:hypothetical protein